MRKLLLAVAGFVAIAGPVTLGVLHTPVGGAQTVKRLEFELAVIKPSAPDARNRMLLMQPGGGLLVKRSTVKELLAMCYGLRPFQISGGPGWMATEHFDIEAKAESTGSSPPDYKKMSEAERSYSRIERKRG